MSSDLNRVTVKTINMKEVKIIMCEYEGWEKCFITGEEFYMNKGFNFFIDLHPVSYHEGIKKLIKRVHKTSDFYTQKD